MKALVGTFNQEKALVGAFPVIVKIFANLRITFVSSSSVEEVRPDVWGQDRDGARQILLHELQSGAVQSGAASINRLPNGAHFTVNTAAV